MGDRLGIGAFQREGKEVVAVLGMQLWGNGGNLNGREAQGGLLETLSHIGRLESPWGGGVGPGASQRRKRGKKEMAA